jgi:hypothetical protein
MYVCIYESPGDVDRSRFYQRVLVLYHDEKLKNKYVLSNKATSLRSKASTQ